MVSGTLAFSFATDMYLITPSQTELERGLESWHWIGLEEKTPVAVTAFGDVFFVALTGIWFLDTLEGTLTRVCGSRQELATILESDEGKNHYLFAGFVQRAAREGMSLGVGECYGFKVAPILGGAMGFENVEKRNLAESLHAAGQMHEQVRKRQEDGNRE